MMEIYGGQGSRFIAFAFVHSTDVKVEAFTDGIVESIATTGSEVGPRGSWYGEPLLKLHFR